MEFNFHWERYYSNATTTNSLERVFISVAILAMLIMLPIYIAWAVIIVKRIISLKSKLKQLKINPTHLTKRLNYKYTTEYHKHLLLLATLLVETSTFLPHIASLTIENLFAEYLLASILGYIIRGFSFIACLATICLINTTTEYVIYICKGYTEFSEIKKKIRRLIITLILLTFLTLFGLFIISHIYIAVYVLFEYVSVLKNSKYLYILLQQHYREQINESYFVYKFQKRLANIYKWFSIFILIGVLIITISIWVELLLSTLQVAIFIQATLNGNVYKNPTVLTITICSRFVVRSIAALGTGWIFLTIVCYSIYLLVRNRRVTQVGWNEDELERPLID